MSLSPVPESVAHPSELNIQEMLDVLRRRKGTFIQVFVVVLMIGIVAASLGKPVYVTEAKLLVPSGSPMVSIIDANNPIAALMAAMQPDSLSTQLQTLQSGALLARAEKAAHVEPRAGVIPPAVTFTAEPDANIIEVSVEGGDPAEIAKLANTVVDLYAGEANDSATSGIERTKKFVQQEQQRQETKLAEAEKRLLQYRQSNKVEQRSSERDTRAGEYAALLARVIETESNLTSTKAQIASLRGQLAKEPAVLVEESVQDNPRIAKIQDKLDVLRFQRMDLLRDFRPTSREVRDLDGQAAALQRELASEPAEIHVRTHRSNATRAALQARLDELAATRQGYEENHNAAVAQFQAKKDLLQNQDTWETDLARLTRERDAVEAACTMLADRLRDLEIRSHAEFIKPARIVEYGAVPTSPIRPHKETNMALSAILALTLALGTVLLQEFLDDRVNRPEEIERLAGLPALAHVPAIGADQPRLVATLPTASPVVEAYRALRSGIGFAGIEAPIRRLQVTSPTQGDGKSTTAANLAVAMARDGKTVVLIDADLRSPTIHHLIEIAPGPGLSELLAGMAVLDEAVRTTEIENLSVIPAGAIPPNPAELLGSPGFDRMLEQLLQRADVVLFDTPPCVPVTDPLIVAARMDAVVLVLKMNETRKGAFKRAVELLGRARARVIGTVFNQVEPDRKGYFYYQQYHYYGEGRYHGNGADQPGERSKRNGKGEKPELERAKTLVTPERRDDE